MRRSDATGDLRGWFGSAGMLYSLTPRSEGSRRAELRRAVRSRAEAMRRMYRSRLGRLLVAERVRGSSTSFPAATPAVREK
jgi:hypothetical protein